jgi:putative PIN family toxin of toxin-antitoxin system
LRIPRAILDTNLFLNFLLSRDPERSAVGLIIKAATLRSFDLLLPEDVLDELRNVVANRPHLAARVSPEALDILLGRLLENSTPLPLLEREPPSVARDANDDYLIALAVLHAADYIVSRDKDLLDLKEIAGVKLVDPGSFLEALRSESESDSSDWIKPSAF